MTLRHPKKILFYCLKLPVFLVILFFCMQLTVFTSIIYQIIRRQEVGFSEARLFLQQGRREMLLTWRSKGEASGVGFGGKKR
jgi:hypothetical protein